MMAASANHQKQKLTLLKSRRLARSIVRQFIPLSQSPLKRLTLVGAGLFTGLSVPALVYASQQQTFPAPKEKSADTSTVTVHTPASSHAEEAVPSQSKSSTSGERPKTSADVTINGQRIPLENGIATYHADRGNSQVDVTVAVDSSTHNSSTASTNISISSHSSSSSASDDAPRGSPAP